MFPCTTCGLCCQNIGSIRELQSFDLGNGICKFLDLETKECVIYDERPDICRIDKMFETKYNQYFTEKAFFEKNAEICNQLQIMHNLDKSYKIILGE